MKRVLAAILIIVVGCLTIEAKNSALLIGIGKYNSKSTGWPIIHGNNDVALLEKKLIAKGFSVFHLIDDMATKSNIVKAITVLENNTSAGDVVYLHFSGHGQLIEDKNGDEPEVMDQSFVCYDACFSPQYKSGGQSYRGQNHLIDDELFPYLNQLKRKIGTNGRLVVVFDSCYSGGADRGEQTDEPAPESEVEWIETTRGTNDIFPTNSAVAAYLLTIEKPDNYSSGGGTVTIISACKSDEKNYECKEKGSGRKYGSLSYCIGKMLDENIPMSQWVNFFRDKRYEQFIIFKPSQNPVIEVHE